MNVNSIGEFGRGPGYLWQGFKLIQEPGVRVFVIIPMLINVSVIVGLTWLFGSQLNAWLAAWLSGLPAWLHWLESLLWWLGFVLALLIFCYLFTLLANLIASPFNGYLSARVEQHLLGRQPESDKPIWAEILTDLSTELRKLAYYLWRALLLGLLSLILVFIPVIGGIVPVLWFAFGAYMLALEYLDFPMSNRGYDFKQKLQHMRKRSWLGLGFGSAVTLLTAVPLANLVVMPAAVAGATALWICEMREPESI